MVFGMGGGNKMEVKVTADTSGFRSSLGDAKKAVGGFKEEVAGIGLAMSAASVGVIGKAVEEARALSGAQRELSKVTDPKTAEEMTSQISRMGNNIPLATEELGNIAAQAGRFGVSGTENMTAFTESVAKMAAATTLETDQAGKAFAKMGSLMDMPMSEAENLGSSINELSNNFATSSNEITKSTMKSAGALSSLGASQQDIVGLNAAMNEVSTSASVAGTGLRRVAQEMVNPKKAEALAGALGMTSDEFATMRSEDPTGLMIKMAETMKENGDGADVLRQNLSTFSRNTLSGLGQNLGNVKEALDMSGKAYEENTSLQKEFEVESASLGSQLQILKNRVNGVLATIGEQFTPVIKDVVKWAQKATVKFAAWNEKSNGMLAALTLVGTAIAGLVPAFLLFVSAIMPALTAIGSLAASAGAAISSVGGLAGAIALLSNPIGWVVAALIALGAAYHTNLFGFRDAVNTVVDQVVNALDRLGAIVDQVLKGNFAKAWDMAKKSVVNGFGAAVDWLKNQAIPSIKQTVTNIVKSITQKLGELQQKLPPIIRDSISAGAEWIRSEGVPLFIKGVQTLVDAGIKTLKFLVTELPGIVMKAVNDGIDWILTNGPPLMSNALGLLVDTSVAVLETLGKELVKTVKWAIGGIVEYIKGIGAEDVKGAFKALGKGIRKAAIALFNMATGIGGVIKDFFVAAASYIKNDAKGDLIAAFKTAVNALITAGKAAFNAITPPNGFVYNAFVAIADYIKNDAANDFVAAVEWLIDMTLAAFEGLYQGLIGGSIIPDMFNDIIAAAKKFGANFLKWLGGLVSDFITDVTKFAVDLVTDFAQLWVDLLTDAIQFYADLLSELASFVADFISDVASFIADVTTAFVNFFADMVTETVTFYADLLSELASFVADFLSDVASWLAETLSKVATKFGEIKDTIDTKVREAYERVKKWFDDIISKVKEILGNIISAITSWDLPGKIASKAKQAYEDFKSKFDIMGAVSDALSDAKSAISSFTPDWPDLSPPSIGGGGGGGIPGFAHGGVVTEPTIAAVGEGGEDEAILPLSKLGGMLNAARQSGDGGSTYNVTVNADSYAGGQAAARGFKDALRSENFD